VKKRRIGGRSVVGARCGLWWRCAWQRCPWRQPGLQAPSHVPSLGASCPHAPNLFPKEQGDVTGREIRSLPPCAHQACGESGQRAPGCAPRWVPWGRPSGRVNSGDGPWFPQNGCRIIWRTCACLTSEVCTPAHVFEGVAPCAFSCRQIRLA